MASKQLETLYKFEKDKEMKAAMALQAAEQDYQQNLQRMSSVSEYRLEYMKRLEQRSLIGIDSATYAHFHAFVAKLDQAGEQVKIAMQQSKALVEQKKALWMRQRQKIQAVEVLKDKWDQKQKLKENRKEQAMFDEIATQQYVRRNLNM